MGLGSLVKGVAKVATGSVGFFTGGVSGLSASLGKGITAQTIAADAAGLSAGAAIAGAALPGAGAISAAAASGSRLLAAREQPQPVHDGSGFRAMSPLDFGDYAAGPGGAAPVKKAEPDPLASPQLAPAPQQLGALVVLGALLLFAMKG